MAIRVYRGRPQEVGIQPAPTQARPGGQPARYRAAVLTARQRRYAPLKRAADVALGLALAVPALPVVVAAAVLVRLTSRGPAFYTQTRVGRGGRPFTIYKVRTMIHNCESLTGPRWSMPGDPRVTFLGRFLRATHLDELPQLWNVLRGDMSLVGPRPERPEFVGELERVVPDYRERLVVRPGVTGLAQVQLDPDTNLHSVQNKLAYDLFYVSRLGLWMDLRVLAATVMHVLGVPFARIGRVLRFPPQDHVLAGAAAEAPRRRQAA